MADFQNVFKRDRFKVEAVGGVVVGRNGLGVAVHHNRFVTVFAHRKRRMHAAVVKFDTLTDSVGAAAQNDDLLFIRGLRFVFRLVGRIHVRGLRFKFRGAGIHALINRADIESMTAVTDVVFMAPREFGKALVGKALLL